LRGESPASIQKSKGKKGGSGIVSTLPGKLEADGKLKRRGGEKKGDRGRFKIEKKDRERGTLPIKRGKIEALFGRQEPLVSRGEQRERASQRSFEIKRNQS